MSGRTLSIALIFSLALSAAAFAEPTDTAATDSQVKKAMENWLPDSGTPDPFDAGSWFWTAQAGILAGDDVVGGQIGVGAGYFIWDDISLTAEGALYYLGVDASGTDDSVGFGFNLIGRWHFYKQDKWSLFVEGGLGYLYTTDDYPVAGAGEHNFSQSIGLGATCELKPGTHLIGAVKYQHTSNAGLEDPNPGFDGVQAYVGLMMSF